ncbi:DUF6017 domain-containing protein [Mediterraneibacter gnavus]|uniref:DNA replication protein DnaD n=1 Tax=Mediterraneibacter gnavus TaxID=33038 RepID=A0AAJ3FC05_MEDGN|nr:DUF6017 domain-containing protein [Mediterraneibacter gnavus]MDU4755428.1 DUF6017 domain-containing protein [Lachnospiraceae bacterium]NSC82088.1 DNA replication protein DnaD [Mediterraneibacter gnavus]NSI25035.1 DNA replication protein DnaD [Mediterraneibacter gnavus]NSI28361.1 DNA replication protein DnaD [Mediterraneibacter gnavus]NSI46240.1 DNA replication protein DnaD [Mediterraneibacter gnavus]
MNSPFETGSLTVDRMSRLQISGNVIPVSWYKTIRKPTGKPNLNAIIILADIVYWYRAVEIRDEMTGQLIGLRKKFHSDMLQRSYQQLADQFGITKRDATNAIIELEKLGAVRRVFRTLEVKGQRVSNVLFLDLNVTVLESLTYPKDTKLRAPEARGRCPPNNVSLKSGRDVTEISERVSPQFASGSTKTSETYTENITEDYSTKSSYQSYQYVESMVKEQIDYAALKSDNPYDERIDELLGIIVEVLTSGAETIRVNREEKPAQVVKGQFHKITKNHIEFVLHSMNESQTKARNIRALLVTALYNSVHTISTYYGNLVQYHMATESYTVKEVEE